MQRYFFLFLIVAITLCSCHSKQSGASADGDTLTMSYAQNITIVKTGDYTTVKLIDPWHQGHVLHTYLLIAHSDSARVGKPRAEGTIVYVPLSRAIVFNTAHANLIEMFHRQKAIAGVADAKYMLIPDIQQRLQPKAKDALTDVGNSMKPDIEKIIDVKPDAIFLSPFENSGGYGRLEEIGVPIIECAEYMETSALGRAEWMKFYGMLFGCDDEADKLFATVEKSYLSLKAAARQAKATRSVLPDRKTGSVWYLPGGRSSVGLLYKDAGGKYAFSSDTHSGSLAEPFETVLDRCGNADFWILNYTGKMNREMLLDEFHGYAELKPFSTGEIYGCQVDRTPYFEEVSWRPDWLLRDYIQLFHPDINLGGLRYFHKL